MPEVFVIEPIKQLQTKKKRVCAYARVSTEEDSQNNSYEFQISYYREYILKHPDWILVDIYSDKGITGTSAEKRPGFQQMIRDCQAGEIDCILVKSVSRFARNIEECLFYIRKLKGLNISVIFEKEHVNTSELDDELLLTFFGCLSEEESRSLSRNIRWTFKRRMEQGLFITTCAPYGYTLQDGNLIVNEQEKPVVQWIYRQFLAGNSCQKIADTLNYFRVPKEKHNGVWTASGIRYLLLNEKYFGDALVQKTYTTDTLPYMRKANQGQREQFYIEHAQDAMITKEEAEKTQRLIELIKPEQSLSMKNNRVLQNKLFCDYCGSKLRYKTNGSKLYWVCQTHVRGKEECPIMAIEENSIYEAFMTMYHKLKINYKKVLVPALQQLELLYQNQLGESISLETGKETIKIQKQIQVLSRLQSRGHLESAIFIEKIRELNEQLKQARGEALMQRVHENQVINRVKTLISLIEKGPQRLEVFPEELFLKMVTKIVITEEDDAVFYLSGGFQFWEKLNVKRR